MFVMSLIAVVCYFFFFFSSRRRHTRLQGDWSSDVCSSDLGFCFKVTDIAGYLKQNPSFRLAIDGALPAGDADLSDRRIDSVREALTAAGVPAYKIYTGAFGDPLLRRERRVEVLFSPRD